MQHRHNTVSIDKTSLPTPHLNIVCFYSMRKAYRAQIRKTFIYTENTSLVFGGH